MSLKLEIVTPEKRVFSDTVDTVVLPGSEGELGVLESHVPLVTALHPGELAYTKEGTVQHLAVGTGFVEITGHRVAVLTDMAMAESDIDEKAVEEALKRAEETVEKLKNSPDVGGEELATVMASIQRSTAQLRVKRRRNSL
ncbi:ATP synthase F1 subunit epsilon [Verrucomicrobium sp. BvORR106]|uniref:ATP synthase F1 subunit epsilon n=1 Tax=Verrucomicrobium sp. BvORR106 TaxID=1403819 RepID=UPI00056FDF74|nr:ATP synthase F1 subunit epsilon [Verrucomicrobium sp. BvORR106]